jgi:hypothetical protein
MTHPLIDQFRFTRGEWLRGLEGVSEADAARRFAAMNCISWTVGHMAWHEHRYWLERAQAEVLYPRLNEIYAYGAPASTPALTEMLAIWRRVSARADPFLDLLTTATLLGDLPLNGKASGQSVGSALRRITYHYWYHTGEIQAIRQMLGQTNLPEYVGDIEELAPYRPEAISGTA